MAEAFPSGIWGLGDDEEGEKVKDNQTSFDTKNSTGMNLTYIGGCYNTWVRTSKYSGTLILKLLSEASAGSWHQWYKVEISITIICNFSRANVIDISISANLANTISNTTTSASINIIPLPQSQYQWSTIAEGTLKLGNGFGTVEREVVSSPRRPKFKVSKLVIYREHILLWSDKRVR